MPNTHSQHQEQLSTSQALPRPSSSCQVLPAAPQVSPLFLLPAPADTSCGCPSGSHIRGTRPTKAPCGMGPSLGDVGGVSFTTEPDELLSKPTKRRSERLSSRSVAEVVVVVVKQKSCSLAYLCLIYRKLRSAGTSTRAPPSGMALQHSENS